MKYEFDYIEKDGILYPDLKLTNTTSYDIGKYGQMHLDFIKAHRRGTYSSLLGTGKLNAYLHKIDEDAKKMLNTIISQLAKERHVDEEFKAHNQLAWVQEMNNIKSVAEEIILEEIIEK